MDHLGQPVLTVTRVMLVLLDQLDHLEPVGHPESVERLGHLDLPALLGLLAQTGSPVPRESRARPDRREMLVPQAPRGHQVPPAHRVLMEFLVQKVHEVLKVPRERPASLEQLAESDPQVPMVTQDPLAQLAPTERTGLRASVVTQAPWAAPASQGFRDRSAHLERRETPERTAHLVQTAPLVPRVFRDSEVLWVCPVSAVRGDSLVFPDLRESLASRVRREHLERGAHLAQSAHLV